MKFLMNKTLLFSLFFIMVGFLSLVAESYFYQDLDSDGILQESLFMPLGMLSVLFGMFLFTCWFLKRVWNWLRRKTLKESKK
ncbi:MAG: DUF3955 domain-containing protein [Lentisphaeria bacterium]|nr:DUF3955 domain-containing protein [Lentisphaeria bacterium]